jgi:uncharacterized protein YneF (UPF0154 family)
MSNPRLIATAVVCLAVGAVGGYKYAEKRLMAEFEEAVDAERNAARAMYSGKVAPNQPFATPQEAVEELIEAEAKEALASYRGEPKEPVAYHKIKPSTMKFEKKEAEAKPDPIQEENIFAMEQEVGDIHVISLQEFESGESDYDQSTLTYWALDKILADEQDEKIEDVAGTIGDEALNQFGLRSGDPNVVHVRNKKLEHEFEIVRSESSWAEEVHGMGAPPERPSQHGG